MGDNSQERERMNGKMNELGLLKNINRYKRAYIAEITGKDEKYKLARNFLGKRIYESKCYYGVDATGELKTAKIGTVIEIVNPSHAHDYRTYYKKTKQGWKEILSTCDSVDYDKILRAVSA